MHIFRDMGLAKSEMALGQHSTQDYQSVDRSSNLPRRDALAIKNLSEQIVSAKPWQAARFAGTGRAWRARSLTAQHRSVVIDHDTEDTKRDTHEWLPFGAPFRRNHDAAVNVANPRECGCHWRGGELSSALPTGRARPVLSGYADHEMQLDLPALGGAIAEQPTCIAYGSNSAAGARVHVD